MKIFSYGLLLAILIVPAWVSAAGDHKHEHSHHGKLEVSDFKAIPSIKLEAIKDSDAGWNLHLITENFTFTPENIGQETDKLEGHAHIYVDDKKVARIYGPWFHLTDLTPGPHTLRVSLNTNNHSEFVLQGEPIAATVEIVEE